LASSSDFLEMASEEAVKSLLTFDMSKLGQNIKDLEELLAKSGAKLAEVTKEVKAIEEEVEGTHQLALYYQSRIQT